MRFAWGPGRRKPSYGLGKRPGSVATRIDKTLMRHGGLRVRDLFMALDLARSPLTRALCMLCTPGLTTLVSLAGLSLEMPPRSARTGSAAVALSSVTTPADFDGGMATSAKVHAASGLFHRDLPGMSIDVSSIVHRYCHENRVLTVT